MGGFREQFRAKKFGLEHEEASDFYLSCWQKNRSSLPLLCVRLVLFLGCLAILLASLILTGMAFSIFGHYFIFLTHWGLIMITVTSGLALAVSAKVYMKGPVDSSVCLPWYIKVYWVSYDIGFTIAFFITIFYYAFLTSSDEEFAVNQVLDPFIHGINSVLMFLLLMTSQHPAHLLHFIYPLIFGIIYLLFGVIYYYAGGVNPLGYTWIYPMIDWSKPGPTSIWTLISAFALIIVHVLVVLICLLRDYVTKKFVRNFNTTYFS